MTRFHRFMVHLTLSAVVWMLCFSFMYGETATRAVASRYFKLTNLTAGQENMAQRLLEVAEEARAAILHNAPAPLIEVTTLYLCQTQKAFRDKTRFKSESIIAAASAEENQIYINTEHFPTLEPQELFATLVHEYAHIYLGRNVKGTMPRWLNEGLAMHLAEQWHFNDYVSLAAARLFGGLISVRDLETAFPGDSRSLHMAYIESYSLVDFIVKNQERYRDGGVKAFVRDLADSRRGPQMLEDLWDPWIRDSLEAAWRRSFGSRIKNVMLVLTSTTVFWMLVALLFLAAYLRKRRRQQQLLREWEVEERIYSSLPKEEAEPPDEEEEEWL